ncbi:ThuA domain-containing protein [Roseimaritima ulvae]|uniref:Trehalose utilization n=1 Tax=Roseimaritima ulvae TaxID=980254 RepID=A0A5B9QXH3_9BACT|nr:Trehalose utilization [Roseimaritima ulvae]
MKTIFSACCALLALCLFSPPVHAQQDAAAAKPLQVVLIAGGCCHDYATQTKLLKAGIEARMNAVVTVVLSPSNKTNARFDIYESDDWADGYDVVLHDECSASVMEEKYVKRILAAHRKGVPAVNIHCAMHSYRWGNFRQPVELGAANAGWYEMLGVQSTGHGPQSPIDVQYSVADHPITKGLEDWTTINEELYNNIRVFGSSTPLATGQQLVQPRKNELKKNPNAKPRQANAVVAWTNEYGPNKTKIFCTTLGHNNDTVGDDRYLDLITRGLLWTTGNLTADGKPTAAFAK